ncbi:MAG: tyrosine-protein phosphatase [Lachnospiraceae bacterium]|nr:tyrosine-protein phosphatase [Lachnospiraceae bacterium]
MKRVRRIKFRNLYNFRDLGGYETGDKGVTAWNRLYRTDCPSKLDDSDWEELRKRNVKTLIDVRSSYEAWEDPVSTPEGFRLIPCPFFPEKEGVDLKGEAGKEFLQSLSIDYCVMAETSAERIAVILQTITESLSEGNTAFFCTAGKDRTGIIAAEILRLCGVSDQDIIADYSITEIYMAEAIHAKLEALPKEIRDQISPETMAVAAYSKAETMERYLKWSEDFVLLSAVEKYGFSKEMQNTLKNTLVSGE